MGEGGHDRDVVALGLGRHRVVVAGLVDGLLRFGRFAASRSVPLNTNAAFHALPFVEPIAYGRSWAGTSSVAVSHASATATYTAPAAEHLQQSAVCASRAVPR